MGLQIQSFEASSSREIDTAFAAVARAQPDALFVAGQTFFNSRRVQLVHLASHHRLPTTYGSRAYPEIGGLMSYGTDVIDAYRQAGSYSGRILKGAKPADLPVVQPSKFQLVINVQIARMLGLTVPQALLTIADEVIE
jgi:putative ABC transport system substrate-binding protein